MDSTDHCVGSLRIIFQPIIENAPPQPYLIYAQRLDCPHVNTGASKATGLFRLKRAMRDNGPNGRVRLGGVVEAQRIRIAVDVEPYFGETADPRLTTENAMEASTSFNLNKYWDKNLFDVLSPPPSELLPLENP